MSTNEVLLALSQKEAEFVSDVFGMWIEGIDEEVPSLGDSEAEAHWSLYELRKQREVLGRVKMRLDLERGVILG